MSKASHAENKTLDWCIGRPAATIIPYLALYTAAPSDSGGGTEVTGNAYARTAIVPADWATATGGSITNTGALTFPTATGNYPAPVTHFGIHDDPTDGNLIRWGALTAPATILSGETPTFETGALELTED